MSALPLALTGLGPSLGPFAGSGSRQHAQSLPRPRQRGGENPHQGLNRHPPTSSTRYTTRSDLTFVAPLRGHCQRCQRLKVINRRRSVHRLVERLRTTLDEDQATGVPFAGWSTPSRGNERVGWIDLGLNVDADLFQDRLQLLAK